MRVALVSNSFLPRIGGAEYVVHHLANAWSRQGHTVLVLNGTTDEATEPDSGYEVARLPLLRGATRLGYHRWPFLPYTSNAVGRRLARFDPAFISAHNADPTGCWLKHARPTAPYVITCHGKDISPLAFGFRNIYGVEPQVRESLSAATAVVALSSQARSTILDLGVPESNVARIPNGVDLDRFRRDVAEDIRALIGVPTEARLVLTVARNHSNKALDTALAAFARVAAKGQTLHYLISGEGSERLAHQVSSLGLDGRVTLSRGLFGDQLVAAYQQCDLFFSSSIIETLPLVILEAMAAGAPVLATDIAGSRELVTDGMTGLLVPAENAEAMADGIRRLAVDRSLASGVRDRACRFVEDYSWGAVSQRYMELALSA